MDANGTLGCVLRVRDVEITKEGEIECVCVCVCERERESLRSVQL